MAIWLTIALAYLAFFLIELRLDYNQLLLPCEGEGCDWAAITEAEAAALAGWGLTTRFYSGVLAGAVLLTVAIFSFLGALIFWREGKSRIGFFVSLFLMISPIVWYADADNVAANYPALALPSTVLSIIGIWIQFVLLYLFPNGKFYPRWASIPLVLTWIVVVITTLSLGGFLPPGLLDDFWRGFVPFLLALALPGVLQIFRYFRNATAVERLQTRWVVFGFVLYFLGPFFWYVFFGGEVFFQPGEPRLLASLFGWVLIQLMLLAFLSTIVIAILRYRLWDLDLIIRRTLIYGSLTGALALFYFGAVVLLQAVFGGLAGDAGSPLVTVMSTLAIAALFNPLRTRLQGFIDRRFYRKKYNAELSIARFAASARDEVDLNRLAGSLLAAVDETMRPETTNLWLRD